MPSSPNFQVNTSRIEFDLARIKPERFESYYCNRGVATFPLAIFNHPAVWLEIGAGSGWFFTKLAAMYPEKRLIAIERSRMRGKRLVYRSKRTGLSNIFAFRGNAIGAMIAEVPTESLERIYILYPCPWVRMSQRRNRWYLHPIMRHLARTLKPGGMLIWASDQEFYIREAQYVCSNKFGLVELACEQLAVNEFNSLSKFEGGRTKFEHAFLASGMPCFELVVSKPSTPRVILARSY